MTSHFQLFFLGMIAQILKRQLASPPFYNILILNIRMGFSKGDMVDPYLKEILVCPISKVRFWSSILFMFLKIRLH